MSETEFIGARLEPEILSMVEDTAKEEQMDKTRALKQLITVGRKQYLLQKGMGKEYINGEEFVVKSA